MPRYLNSLSDRARVRAGHARTDFRDQFWKDDRPVGDDGLNERQRLAKELLETLNHDGTPERVFRRARRRRRVVLYFQDID